MRNLSATIAALLLAQQAAAQPDQDARAAFRQAVEEYQLFVVPRCAPAEVQAYVVARADRDRAFVRSLRRKGLRADYDRAVADRAARDRNTVFHCFGPPPPPPPPPLPPGSAVPAPAPVETPSEQRDPLAAHFAGGDRQFEKMLKLRDAASASRRR